jgi:vancomycin resistance protein VanJ
VLHALTGERYWWVSIATDIIHWLLLPAFPLLGMMLWKRCWWGAALAGVNIMAFLLFFGGLFLPNISHSGDAEQAITLMTYNAGNDQVAPDALVTMIYESGADIVGLQEISPSQVALLETQLNGMFPYHVLYGYGAHSGIGFLSRYPILEEELLTLQWASHPHQRATLAINGRRLTLIVFHPPPPIYDIRPDASYQPLGNTDIAALAEMAADRAPTIMLGDLNATSQSVAYGLLRSAGLTDAFQAAGWGFGATFPNRMNSIAFLVPLVRIDYVWYTDDFRATRAWVGPDAGSDHLPVLAELVWEEMR